MFLQTIEENLTFSAHFFLGIHTDETLVFNHHMNEGLASSFLQDENVYAMLFYALGRKISRTRRVRKHTFKSNNNKSP